MWVRVLVAFTIIYVVGAAIWVVRSGFTRNVELLNVACDPTRELWHDINHAFIDDYERKHGVRLSIRQSHGGSGSQARAVIDGLPADVVTLALWTDTEAIRKAGLIDADWENRYPNRSLPYTSTIVFVVRKGNPKNIRDWADLTRSDIEIVTPNPKTSGNGKWSFLAMWGSVMWRGGTEDQAREFVTRAFKQVKALDTAARAATVRFAKQKQGDVHLTWENEAHLEVKEAGDNPDDQLEIVYPGANTPGGAISVLAEPHVAVVDANVQRRGTAELANEYVLFMYSVEAKKLIIKNFHRPFEPELLDTEENRDWFVQYRILFPKMDLRRGPTLVPSGKWEDVQKKFFAEGGVFDQIQAAGR